MKIVLAALAALALLATAVAANANCYEHCHDDGRGNTSCHVNCY
jgi:hypothetical protein